MFGCLGLGPGSVSAAPCCWWTAERPALYMLPLCCQPASHTQVHLTPPHTLSLSPPTLITQRLLIPHSSPQAELEALAEQLQAEAEAGASSSASASTSAAAAAHAARAEEEAAAASRAMRTGPAPSSSHGFSTTPVKAHGNSSSMGAGGYSPGPPGSGGRASQPVAIVRSPGNAGERFHAGIWVLGSEGCVRLVGCWGGNWVGGGVRAWKQTWLQTGT